MKPFIGVIPLIDIQRNSYWMIPGYMKGIEDVGGIPIMLPFSDDNDIIESIADKFSGFLFTGGQDLSPKIYGEQKMQQCGEISEKRDDIEKKLFNALLEKNKPMLGICRGIQIFNAFLGGTLYQDLDTQYSSNIIHKMKPPYDRNAHYVKILGATPLSSIFTEKTIGVNSYHHQAIKELAPELEPMALSEDGLIEAVYMKNKNFVWGVQWHPELSYKTDENMKQIFAKFVEECDIYLNK